MRAQQRAFSAFVVGGLIESGGGEAGGGGPAVSQTFDGAVDSVSYYKRKVDAERVAELSVDAPCASGFTGDGFVFFPVSESWHSSERVSE